MPPPNDASAISGIIEELRPSVRSEPREEVRAPEAERSKILIVEDNVDMNRFISQCLRGEYDVVSAYDGHEGLEKAIALSPAIIVADIMMPVMSGADMVAEIRRRPELAETCIVLLSAKADEELKVRLLETGAQDFITKPFAERDLQVRIRNMSAMCRSRQALRESEARARIADQRKDEFLAMLGHELRNPLAPIMTALQLMNLRGETSSAKERLVIDRQVKHLARLVDDLLDVARMTQSKLEITLRPISLPSVIEKAVEMASPLFEQRCQSLRIEVPRHGLTVDGDPDRLAQVVSNLLTNAAKFTDPGGSVVLTAHARDKRVFVSVKDNGRGIGPEQLTQIFGLFVQGERISERGQAGLGIGLALVRSLVELHGGRVYAHSAGLGRGSEFVIELPAAGDEPAAASSLRLPTAPTSAKLRSRILLVDDNVDAADGLAEMLDLLGYDVLVAHDGPQALAIAETYRPMAALLDIGLPGMDGYEVACLLRAAWGDHSVRFFAITGYGREADKARAQAAGFDAHLVKPVDVSELVALLQSAPTAADG
jgi:signal transduction histidine kinase